jgi:hypothetical protein
MVLPLGAGDFSGAVGPILVGAERYVLIKALAAVTWLEEPPLELASDPEDELEVEPLEQAAAATEMTAITPSAAGMVRLRRCIVTFCT